MCVGSVPAVSSEMASRPAGRSTAASAARRACAHAISRFPHSGIIVARERTRLRWILLHTRHCGTIDYGRWFVSTNLLLSFFLNSLLCPYNGVVLVVTSFI